MKSLLVVAATASVVVVAPGNSGAAPAPGLSSRPVQEPTIDEVNRRLDELSRRAGALAEQFNAARLDVRRAQAATVVAKNRAAAAVRAVAEQQRQFAVFMNAQYQGGPQDSGSALLTSTDQGNYLQQLSTADMMSKLEGDHLAELQNSRQAASAATERAKRSLANANERSAQVEQRKQAVQQQTDRYTTLLATLSARELRNYVSGSDATPAQIRAARSVKAPNAAAQRAINFALDQVGKPYVFGAAGPSSYDCSGLTMAAWQAGGVSLPHLASSQFNYGKRVNAKELQAGDLVFLYDDLSHVALYIGNGLLVNAPQPGENVSIVPFAHFASDFVGGSRLK